MAKGSFTAAPEASGSTLACHIPQVLLAGEDGALYLFHDMQIFQYLRLGAFISQVVTLSSGSEEQGGPDMGTLWVCKYKLSK